MATRGKEAVAIRAKEAAAFALIVAMVLGSLVLWMAVPLGWLWVASRINQSLDPSFTAYAAVAIGIPVTMMLVFQGLRRLDMAHRALTGTATGGKRTPPPWLRSMREERDVRTPTSALDVILVATAIAAGLVLVAWFFLFAGSPLPS